MDIFPQKCLGVDMSNGNSPDELPICLECGEPSPAPPDAVTFEHHSSHPGWIQSLEQVAEFIINDLTSGLTEYLCRSSSPILTGATVLSNKVRRRLKVESLASPLLVGSAELELTDVGGELI